MSKFVSTRTQRLASASIFVLVVVLSLGLWTLFWDPAPSSAASPSNPDLGAITAKLEELHQRTAARSEADDDDQTASPHLITPEQAAMLAQQLARARGDAAPHHHYIELQTRNGRPAYVVQLGAGPVFIDAATGAIAN